MIVPLNSGIRVMKLIWPAVVLLLCQTIEEYVCEVLPVAHTDPPDLLKRNDTYFRPLDFRCHDLALTGDFDFSEYFVTVGHPLEDYKTSDKKYICTNWAKQYYPILKGLDPMMPYYINTLHRGIALANNSNLFLSRKTPLQRTKFYCASLRSIAVAFLEYFESFHSDSNLCGKMVEFIKNCHMFLQMREMFSTRLYEKLCLDEDGCYNVMTYYEDDLPYCVKTTAISKFNNSSVGSWHHSIINYCKLAEMVPGIEAVKYDRTILTQTGRTKDNLRDICLYLRYRVLPEEGKEQEIADDAAEYDAETTSEMGNKNGLSLSILVTTLYWSIFCLMLVI